MSFNCLVPSRAGGAWAGGGAEGGIGTSKSLASALVTAVLVAVFGVVGGHEGGPDAPGDDAGRRSRGGEIQEATEQQATTELRLEALAEARREGTLGLVEELRRRPAPGWAGEVLLHPQADDWEPAIAADPRAPFVYVLHNRYGGVRACRHCPSPTMILQVSRDGGRTFGPERYLCRCRGFKGQFDPVIEVVPDTGAVYAAWMNDFDIHFSRSLDHGRTWSRPVSVMGSVRWGDKPILATGADGTDVYIAFNGPTGGDNYVAISHDAGRTWTQVRTTQSDRYHYAYGGYVGPDGTVTFTEISFTYTGPNETAEGPVLIHVFTSTDAGLTWTETVVDTLELGPPCRSRGCYPDFHDSGPALAGDADGDLVIVYSGARRPGRARSVYARSSTDGGLSWGPRVRLSRVSVNAAFPAAVGVGDGEVRVLFMDRRRGWWNVRYRVSHDLGTTWSEPLRISDASSGTAYKSRRGFREVYGDYGEIAVTDRGLTVAVWGEGSSYAGPGGVWFNRERPHAR